MKVTGSTIQQLDKSVPRSRCRDWRIWATTEEGRKSERFHGTYTQAQERQKAFVEELEAFVPNSDTFGAFADSWRLWREESGGLSPNTVTSERTFVRLLKRTDLCDMRMDEITSQDCRDALLWLKQNPVKGDEYRQTTMAKMHQVLGAVMKQAVEDGRLARNPMDSVKRPKTRPKEREALTPDELQMFLNRVDELPVDGRTTALYLMACLGLRVGEACAIRDDQIGAFAEVDSTVRSADNTVGPPKSAAGRRKLPVPPRLAERVELWRAAKRALGYDSKYLCCNKRGTMLTVSSVEWWWIETRDSLGCPGMTMHQLRHSNLSMMARHMSPFDLQRYAGWSSIAPAKIYIHDDLDAVSRAVEMAWA